MCAVSLAPISVVENLARQRRDALEKTWKNDP
jgi:hypothetical protein